MDEITDSHLRLPKVDLNLGKIEYMIYPFKSTLAKLAMTAYIRQQIDSKGNFF